MRREIRRRVTPLQHVSARVERISANAFEQGIVTREARLVLRSLESTDHSAHYLDDGVERVESFREGELLPVPHGIEHKPVAYPGTELMLIERLETSNTGNVVESDRRREPLPL